MSINTRKRFRVVHSHPGIRALSLLNKAFTSFHMKLSLGELLLLLTNSCNVLHALHLSLLSTSEHPSQSKTTVLNSPLLYGVTWSEICLGKTSSFLVWRKIKYNLLPLIRSTSQSYVIPKCQPAQLLTNPQAHLKKMIRLWYFIIQKKSNSKTIKFKLWGVENPKVF